MDLQIKPVDRLWGSDAPYHSYITRRHQGFGVYREFRLKGTCEQEVDAWRGLTEAQQRQVNAIYWSLQSSIDLPITCS